MISEILIFVMDYHRLLKAFHVIFIIMWMAGMLYLPRLYVYHATVKPGSENDGLLKIMEKRLLRFIINPAMLLSLVFGITLTIKEKTYQELWFHIKATALIPMFIIHMLFIRHMKDFTIGLNKRSHIYFRILNEVITLLIIIIIFAVILKPSY